MQRVVEDAEPALTEAIVLASCKSPPNYKEPKRMKILVTGGTGHVGSEVVKELQKRKADVRILIPKKKPPLRQGFRLWWAICSIQSLCRKHSMAWTSSTC